mgnify:CR=1 FL=1
MKLVYFNGRGLAETSRLILALNEEKYEVSIANVFKIFNMADLEIRKIHESNGTPVSD